jgi:hypothetical protein
MVAVSIISFLALLIVLVAVNYLLVLALAAFRPSPPVVRREPSTRFAIAIQPSCSPFTSLRITAPMRQPHWRVRRAQLFMNVTMALGRAKVRR